MSVEVMKQALEALETEQALRHGYSYRAGVRVVSTADEAINALRTAIQRAETKTDELVQVFLVRDVASLLGASVPDVCDALAELGYEPRRSTNAAISPDEAIAVAKRINPATGVPDAAIDSAIYSQCPDFDDWHEGPSIDDIRSIVRAAIQQAEAKQPATPNVDVRTILLAIVPGDGNGEEVYAESVDDVVAKMTELSEREESLRTQVDLLTAAVEARGREIAKLKATGEPVMDVRCEGCGYMTHHREHMGCVRAAKQFTHPAPGVPDDVVRDAISTVREQYRGTDWGKAAECICDAIDAAMTAAQSQKGQP